MIARNLTIASLVCGGLGSLMFLGYKSSGAEKNSFVGHSSKFLIAVGVFLLAVAVLDLTKENYFDEGDDLTHFRCNDDMDEPIEAAHPDLGNYACDEDCDCVKKPRKIKETYHDEYVEGY